nr:hypothetical protein [Tanacetum cinerariifolium]
MAARTQPTLSHGMSTQIAEVAALSLSSFCKTYRSYCKTPSPSSSLTLPVWKRYRSTSKLILDTKTEDESLDPDAEREVHGLDDEAHGLKDEGPSSEEEAAPKGQQQAVLVDDIAASEPLGLSYRALRLHELALGEGLVHSTFELGQSSRSVPEHEVMFPKIGSSTLRYKVIVT